MEFDIVDYLTDLTPYELLQSYYLARSALLSDVTIFTTFLFAYVSAAYFVSAKLTRFQAVTISSLYSFFALFIASAAYNSSVMVSNIGFAIRGVDTSREALILITFLLLAWIFSIILFIQARRIRDA